MYRQFLVLRNDSKGAYRLFIEPWGDFVEMPIGRRYTIAAQSDYEGSYVVDFCDDMVKIWAWKGSMLAVFNEKDEIIWSSPLPSP